MSLSPQIITKDLYNSALKHLKELGQVGRKAIRLRAIVSAKEYGVGVVAKIFNVDTNTIRAWAKNFQSNELDGLEYKAGRGRKSNLSELHLNAIAEQVKQDSSITIVKIVMKLKELYDVDTSRSAVHRALKKLNFSHISPRPKHYKKDEKRRIEFKKKSTEKT
jgi:transposase